MPELNRSARPIFSSVAAQLFVRDLKTSTDFFTTKLGFTIDFVYGDPPFYGQVSRDNARLALRHVDEPVFAGDIRELEALLSASITLGSADEIEQLFLACQASDVPFRQVLRNEPWGAKTFIVKDPDGNLILLPHLPVTEKRSSQLESKAHVYACSFVFEGQPGVGDWAGAAGWVSWVDDGLSNVGVA